MDRATTPSQLKVPEAGSTLDERASDKMMYQSTKSFGRGSFMRKENLYDHTSEQIPYYYVKPGPGDYETSYNTLDKKLTLSKF